MLPKISVALTPLYFYLLLTLTNEGNANIGQRIVTIELDGTQYYVSKMNPYSSEMNYFLAYQYCRSIGLQLVSFETQEKADTIAEYLKNAGYSQHDFWTSGNHLGSNMLLWMSTGLPFNATFNYMRKPEGDDPIVPSGPLPMGRKKRGGMTNTGCIALKANELDWDTEDCSKLKEFICEQTRCYFYNYGSIHVSTAQGHFNRHKEPSSTSSTTASPTFQTSAIFSSLVPSTTVPSSSQSTTSPVLTFQSSDVSTSSDDAVLRYAVSKSSSYSLTTTSSPTTANTVNADTELPDNAGTSNENIVANNENSNNNYNNTQEEINEVDLTTTETYQTVDYQSNNTNDDTVDEKSEQYNESSHQQQTPLTNRTRTTKTLDTENSHSARIMPDASSESFPWPWAKNILLEKPVMKKTVPL